MIKLYHSPLSRSVRIVWLLEELDQPYELISAPLEPPDAKPFAQKTPFGKVPAIEDAGIEMFESGAILEYILERYGQGRLAPESQSPLRAHFLQWVHFAESTAFIGLGNIAWHTRIKQDTETVASAIVDYRVWAEAAVDTLEQALGDSAFILGDEFSGADIMLGYTLMVARAFGVLTPSHQNTDPYLTRLTERPGFRTALSA
jgi:glutathione S-transferase